MSDECQVRAVRTAGDGKGISHSFRKKAAAAATAASKETGQPKRASAKSLLATAVLV
jgi:hypothetical protein